MLMLIILEDLAICNELLKICSIDLRQVHLIAYTQCKPMIFISLGGFDWGFLSQNKEKLNFTYIEHVEIINIK